MPLDHVNEPAFEEDRELREQVNKRLTLNLLIQGAATHTCIGAHYLVREELDAIDSRLIRLYDKFSISVCLAQWISDFVLFFGTSRRFWKSLPTSDHLFRQHPLLLKHGRMLSDESYRFTKRKAREKRTVSIPVLHTASTLWQFMRIMMIERKHKTQLEHLARKCASSIWGIEQNRLLAKLTTNVEFGQIKTPETTGGKAYRQAAAGWGGVQRIGGRFYVVARAWSWTLLIHELVKGTAELVCLHGLNELDDDTYDAVMEIADQIDYEIWMLQAGGELWRRLLRVLPQDVPLAECLMHIARLKPIPLEMLMFDVIEDPDAARRSLSVLCRSDND